MTKRWAVLAVTIMAVAIVAGVFAVGAMAQEPKAASKGEAAKAEALKGEESSFWMKKKLQYSEQILAGLAKEDYEAIAKNARSMNMLSHMERWVRSSLPEYRAQLRIFENANQQLIRAADAEQLDGAALAYVQLTLSCVNCHKVVRDSASESAPRKP
jgi:cytochrome c556